MQSGINRKTALEFVCQGCTLLTIFFKFVTEMVTKAVSSSCENSVINVYADRKLSDLEYASDVVLLSDNLGKMKGFLHC